MSPSEPFEISVMATNPGVGISKTLLTQAIGKEGVQRIHDRSKVWCPELFGASYTLFGTIRHQI